MRKLNAARERSTLWRFTSQLRRVIAATRWVLGQNSPAPGARSLLPKIRQETPPQSNRENGSLEDHVARPPSPQNHEAGKLLGHELCEPPKAEQQDTEQTSSNLSADKEVYVRIYGHVQGVGFRSWLNHQAEIHGLDARASNDDDGSVKAVFSGASAAIDAIISKLRNGPTKSRVDHLIISRTRKSQREFLSSGRVQPLSEKIAWTPSTIQTFSKIIEEHPEQVNKFCDDVTRAYWEQNSRQAWVMNRLLMQACKSGLREPALRLAESLSGEQLSEANLRNGLLRDARLGESFRSSQAMQWTLRRAVIRFDNLHPATLLANKLDAVAYASLFGVRTPVRHQAGIPHTDIEARPGTVIKPNTFSGHARGVFQILNDGAIYDVQHHQFLESEAVMFNRIRDIVSKGANTGRADSWIVEQFIEGEDGNPPKDIKFYCFYGDIPLILEIQRFPRPGWNFFNADGSRVVTGKYEGGEFQGGTVFTKEELEIVRKLSLSVPLPFMRIDFMRSKESDLVLTEFTSTPGRFHEHNFQFDRILGRHFIDAEARLYQDLLSGAPFSAWKEFARSHGTSSR